MSNVTTDSVDAVAQISDGDTAWILASSALVMIMTPGLGFFYGGLVRHTNILATIGFCYITFALVTVLWYLLTFSMVFGPSSGNSHFIGTLQYAVLINVTYEPHPYYGPTIPFIMVFFFQLKFAAITPALISGAISTRVKVGSFIVFVITWSIFVYAPIGHWVWNQHGWAMELGAIDFAGGTVVHVSSGYSALAAAIITGRRQDTRDVKPCNIPLVLIGNALLWFGWFGFNGGSALAANGLAANACVVTNGAAAAAAITWMALEFIFERKTSVVGFAVGSVVGLVAITPGSGYCNLWGAIIIGVVGSLCVYGFCHLKKKCKFPDDTLDAFTCHGVAGTWGSIAVGLFATKEVNPASFNGACFGDANLLWKQIVVTLAAAGWAFTLSALILLAIKYTIGLRVSEEAEKLGLDKHLFNEQAMGELYDNVHHINRKASYAVFLGDHMPHLSHHLPPLSHQLPHVESIITEPVDEKEVEETDLSNKIESTLSEDSDQADDKLPRLPA